MVFLELLLGDASCLDLLGELGPLALFDGLVFLGLELEERLEEESRGVLLELDHLLSLAYLFQRADLAPRVLEGLGHCFREGLHLLVHRVRCVRHGYSSS